MDGGALVALLVLSVLLVGVPSMARRRAELGAWHAAGRGEGDAGAAPRAAGDGPRGLLALTLPGLRRPARRASSDAAPAADAVDGALALRAPGTGLRRCAPGPRVLERRSAVPRPRCAPGASSGPVLAGRPAPVRVVASLAGGGPTRAVALGSSGAPAPGRLPTATSGSAGDAATGGAGERAGHEVVPGQVVAPGATTGGDAASSGPGAGASPVAPSVTPAGPSGEPSTKPSTGPSTEPQAVLPTALLPVVRPAAARPAAGGGAGEQGRRGGSRPAARPSARPPAARGRWHLVLLAALAVGAAVVGVLAALGVVPAATALVLPVALGVDLVLLRRAEVRRRARRRARSGARTAGAPRAGRARPAGDEGAQAPGRRDAAEQPLLLTWDDEPAPGPTADGVVTGLLTPLADLRASAAAEAAGGLRGPAGSTAPTASAPATGTPATHTPTTDEPTAGQRRPGPVRGPSAPEQHRSA